MGDVKEIVGTLMRVVGGGEATVEEIQELDFESDPQTEALLNVAYIILVEFAFDRDNRAADPALDAATRRELALVLDQLARFATGHP